jgi:hypothetical protein
MWELSGWAAWVISALIFAWLVWDFFKVNLKVREEVLLSSREGVDELFSTNDRTKG